MTLDKGEILDVEGVRFRDGDRITGRGSWKASSRLIRTTAVAKKPAGKAKAKQQAFPKSTGPSTFGPMVAPNGVILTLKNVSGSTLAVQTAQGRFEIPLDRLADGSAVSLLNNRVRAQRTFPHAPLWEGAYQQDFPAAAPSTAGPGAWVAAVWHQPRGPELLPALTERPRNFARFGTDRRRGSGSAAPGLDRRRCRQARRTTRCHRAWPRRLAPGCREYLRWERHRRLDRETRW